VLIGPRFKPFYASDRGADLGVHTWPADAWRNGGGTVWGWISYDPQLNLIYYGTSNPGPWNHEQRPGDNKWTAGVFARDVDTGEAVWFYQMSPHDLWDYDGVNEQILADIPIGGRTRKVMMRADRDGYVYVIDRTSGEVISADPFVPVTSTKGIDLKSGRPIENEELKTVARQGHTQRMSRVAGRKGLAADGLLAAHGPLLHPFQQSLHGLRRRRGELHSRHAVCRRECPHVRRPGRKPRRVHRVGSRRAKEGVVHQRELPGWSGVAVTASDVAFYGTMDGGSRR
jgi:hypothetical protein